MSSSTAHESVLLWLRDDPSWLRALLELTGHAPCSATLAVQDSALREAFPLEVTPDLVLRDGERFGRVAADLARRALERAETVADARLRRVTKEGILAVLHPTLTEQLRSALMIDINQLPKNPVLERWKAELRAEGEARGVALGEASGEARLLVRILHRRGFVLSADLAARVLATTDIERIERWADRALVAATLDAVFVED